MSDHTKRLISTGTPAESTVGNPEATLVNVTEAYLDKLEEQNLQLLKDKEDLIEVVTRLRHNHEIDDWDKAHDASADALALLSRLLNNGH